MAPNPLDYRGEESRRRSSRTTGAFISLLLSAFSSVCVAGGWVAARSFGMRPPQDLSPAVAFFALAVLFAWTCGLATAVVEIAVTRHPTARHRAYAAGSLVIGSITGVAGLAVLAAYVA